MKKAVFFDIDGTIWDRDMNIPKSTAEAIKELQANNIYTFLCSGRTRCFIRAPKLMELGFDGVLAGCGTYVEYQNKEIFYETLDKELVSRTLEVLRRYRMPVVLEGKHNLYVEEQEFEGDPFLERLRTELGDALLNIGEHQNQWEISKFSATISDDSFTEALEQLKPWYDFMVHGKVVVEGVPKGYNKATGIQAACKALGIPKEETYAFGDSVNDLDMLRYAAHGIAMGSGMQEAKEAADYVTDGLHEDGIYNACRYFGLI